MSSPNIHSLFNPCRINNQQDFPKVLLYFPFGFALLLFRLLVLGVTWPLLTFLPKDSRLRRHMLRCLSSILGIIIVKRDGQNQEHTTKLLVCNHISILDHIAVEPVFPCTQVNICSHFLPDWSLGSLYENSGFELRSNASYSIVVFPECGTTNGKHGLLKFSSSPFEMISTVQPVIIEIVKTSFINISPSVIGASEWCDLLWLLFVPCTVYNLRVLPSMSKMDKESAEDFSKRVQSVMALSLNIIATEYTFKDKKEYEKRLTFLSSNQPEPARHQRNVTQLNRMAEQVKEVLPYVPLNVIVQDLRITKSVDDTIFRLIEGMVHFEPENKSSPSSSKFPEQINNTNRGCTQTSDDKISLPLNTAAEKFGKTPRDRMQSYQERKLALVDSARRRYLQKHSSN